MEKFTNVLGVLAVLSGVYLVISSDYFIGISGGITGLFLIYLQYAKAANQSDEE